MARPEISFRALLDWLHFLFIGCETIETGADGLPVIIAGGGGIWGNGIAVDGVGSQESGAGLASKGGAETAGAVLAGGRCGLRSWS